ncbi:flagellar basal body protein [Neorhizobium galegae]|uniref:flagellar basal body protein n=1 Tax=Neorhizobium galegae TaxID=399 RepID=UPI000621D906|nr:flagellar basal body protein [Neorhizobium galegae]CDZ27339.1 Flagellar basal body rod protein [Neorhizobium galegae bv. officinalis]KAA9387306.1 flagellar basal body rod protein [Neorhizobium galegae]KAB1114452.1 flagellar basal body rod protein [Neorhizobium galegae]MCM2501105.1 flagellar basal body protein [Neorhizobium galegae]MCQ1771666.1 flagellar basal body protein [Neorhizobium galegae]
MGLSSVMSIAVSGMQAQAKRLATAAHNIANAGTPGYNRLDTHVSTQTDPGGVTTTVTPSTSVVFPDSSNVDMASEMLDALTAAQGFRANAAAFETGADMWDVLMSIKRD